MPPFIVYYNYFSFHLCLYRSISLFLSIGLGIWYFDKVLYLSLKWIKMKTTTTNLFQLKRKRKPWVSAKKISSFVVSFVCLNWMKIYQPKKEGKWISIFLYGLNFPKVTLISFWLGHFCITPVPSSSFINTSLWFSFHIWFFFAVAAFLSLII